MVRAEADGNQEKVKVVKTTIESKGTKKMWYCINRSQTDPHRPSPHVVQRAMDRKVEESTSKQETKSCIFEENHYKFDLAT